ncbi:hypothetical protein CBR_g4027 [Chara braunii]|uniref:Uncharacterized protein n=1 Tax=Chara braunii TaxID=69332 RepID=A0A388KH14_CHABU|nr:hypothetical protein CBR_g4027 [Chara braunii]|eukprot:GBG69331.1 hypothetical protein CBR_g4027 [Chara braunii]
MEKDAVLQIWKREVKGDGNEEATSSKPDSEAIQGLKVREMVKEAMTGEDANSKANCRQEWEKDAQLERVRQMGKRRNSKVNGEANRTSTSIHGFLVGVEAGSLSPNIKLKSMRILRTEEDDNDDEEQNRERGGGGGGGGGEQRRRRKRRKRSVCYKMRFLVPLWSGAV